MNDLVRLAQNSLSPPATVTRVTLTKPSDGVAQVLAVAPGMVLDLKDIAAQNIVLVHAGDRLIILFADSSAIVLTGFYGRDGHPMAGLEVDLGRGAAMPASDIASLLPVSEDASILPAAGPASAGGDGPPSALHASAVVVDALGNGPRPLDLLSSEGAGRFFTDSSDRGLSTGPNRVPTFGGQVTGAVTEDAVVSIVGALTISDQDGGQSQVVAQSRTTGTYGTFSIDTAGAWNYTLNNDDQRVQALAAGQILTESFSVTSFDGSASQVITVTINGTNDIPVLGGLATGSVTEDGALKTSGTLTISDVDTGQSSFVPQNGTIAGHGVFSIDAAGHWSYTLDNGDPAVQALGAGKILTDSIVVTSFDGSATKTIAVAVTGTNDVPVVGGVTVGSVTEDGILAATGVLTIADVDSGESSFVVQLGTPGKHGSFSVDAAGSWTYTLTNGDPDVQALGAGKTLTETFVVASFDGTASETVTVTIEGTNDVPVLGGTVAGTVQEDVTLTATGVLTISDTDTGEASFVAQTATPGLYGSFSVDAAGNWSYALDNTRSAVQALGADKSLTETFSVVSFDGSASETVTVTIRGTNDVPVLGGAVAGTVREDVTLIAQGVLTISDTDTGEASFAAQTATPGLYGSFSVDAAGNWSYALDNTKSAVQALGANKSLTETFSVVSFDGSASETVTVTINGTNDVPVLGGTIRGAFQEDVTLTANGTLTISDTDTGEASFVAQSATPGLYGSFSVDAAGNWSYALDNTKSAVQALGANKSLTETFSVVSFDGSASETVTVTINGTNDVPVIGGAATGSVKEDSSTSVTGTLTISDPDTGESKFIAQTSTAGTYGTFSVTAAGAWTYALANSSAAVQALGAGAHPTETFTVVSADGSAQQTVVITVNGTNDVPTLFGVTNGSVTEDGTQTAAGKVSITDKDTGESVYTVQTGTAGTYGTFAVDATGQWTYTLNNSSSAVQSLGAGVNPTETFKVFSADQSANLTITLTVKGANDVPTVGGTLTGFVTEDVTTSATGGLTISDPDSGQSGFIARTNVAGTYGSFSVNTAGAWTYTLNNASAAVQALGANSHPTETFAVTSSDGTVTKNVVITVNGSNDAPVASDATVSVSEDGTLTGKTVAATDADHDAMSYALVGSAPTGLTFNSNGTWSYAPPASYQSLALGQSANVTFQFKANDGTADSNVATETITITGANDLPQARADSGTMTEDGGTQTFNLISNDTLDPDNGATNSISVGSISVGTNSLGLDASDLSVTATATGVQVALLGTDWDKLVNFSSVNVIINYNLNGNVGDVSSNQLTLSVTGLNDAPVLDASKSPAMTLNEDAGGPSSGGGIKVSTLVSFAGSGIGNVTDPDNTLTGIAVTGLNSSNGTWYWSATGSGWSVIPAGSLSASHALVLDAGYSLYFQPNANFSGTIADGITFRAWDHSGGTPGAYADTSVNNGGTTPYSAATDTVSVNVNPVNDAPVAPGASVAVSEDGTLTGQNVTATDVDGDHLTYAVFGTAPSGLIFNSDGTWAYVPPAAFQGLDSGEAQQVTFQYKANDGTVDSNAGTVTITVNGANDAPVAQGASVSVSEDGTLTGQAVTATDVDIEPLTYAVVGTPPAGLTFNSNGTWSYAPPVSFQALDTGESQQVTFQYKANDGTVDSSPATVTITINGANDAPVAQSGSASVSEDGTLTGQAVTATDVDIETLTFAVVGTAPAGLTFSPNGTWSYAPPASLQALDSGESQQVTFQYKANDGTVDSNTSTITITVNGANDAPVAQIASASVSEDGTLTGQVVTATDVDIETLTYAVVGTAPAGLVFNSNGTWSYAPPASFQSLNDGQSAQVTFQYKANDGTVDSNVATVTITVNGANDAPAAQDGSASVTEDGSLAGQSVIATEPGATLTYAVVGTAPSGLSFHPDGTWSYAPPASFQSLDTNESAQVTFQYKANDGTADSNIATVTITVTGANDAPVAQSASASVSEDGTLTGQSVVATDVDVETLTYAVVGTAPSGLVFDPNGTWSYAPPASFQALDTNESAQVTFQYKANDGTVDSSPATVTITINGANDAPVAQDGSVSVSEDGTLSGRTVTATDVDVETLTYTLVGGATSGLTFNTDGTWSYAPPASYQSLALGQNAQVTFQYKANDGSVDSNVATETITITGANDAPAAKPDSGAMTEGQGTTSFNVLGNDTLDIDSGALNNITAGLVTVYFATSYGLDASDIAVTASGSNLQVSLVGSDWDRLAAFASVVVTVNYTLHGDQPSDFSTNQLTLTVTGVNDAPVLDATQTPTMSVGANAGAPVGAVGTLVSSLADPVGGGGLDNVADPDNTVFGIAVTGVNGAAGTWYYSTNNGSSWTAIAAGSVSATHALLLNPDYLVYFQPAANSSGTVADVLTFRAWDHSTGTQGTYVDSTVNGGTTAYSTATDTISVKVINQPAVISGTTSGAVTEAGGVANGNAGTPTASGDLNSTDADNPADSWQAVSAPTASTGGYGSYTIDATGHWSYALDNSNATVGGLAAGATLNDTFTVKTIDGTPQLVTITITGADDAAVITGASTGAVTEAGASGAAGTPTASGDLNATDADNPADAWTVVSTATASTGGYGAYTVDATGHWTYTLDNSNSTVNGLTAGATLSDTFTVTTADGTNRTIAITIAGVNDAPVLDNSVSDTAGFSEDPPIPLYQAVSSLIRVGATGLFGVTDPDSVRFGIAVTHFDGSHGTWSWTSDATTWHQIDASSVSDSNALLLHSTYWLAFQPFANSNGSIPNAMLYRAWDESSGTAGSFADTSVNGGTTAFSAAVERTGIVIQAVNDAAVITGDKAGDVTEAGAAVPGSPTATGDLNATDIDNANDSWQAVTAPTASTGGFGTYTIDAAGHWIYVLDNNNPAVNGLAGGATLSDTFSVKTIDGTPQLVTVTITGTNDAPVLGGTTAGAVTEDGTLSATGALTITDADAGQSSFVAQSGTAGSYGSFAMTAAGAWTYTLNNGGAAVQGLTASSHPTETFTVQSADGTSTSVVITVNGANDAPVLGGTTTGAVTEDGTLTASGALTIADADIGQSSFVAQTSAAGSHGRFSVAAAGVWTYTLNNADTAVQALNSGQTLTDSFSVASSDGSASETVIVTINGANEAGNVNINLDNVALGVGGFKIIGQNATDGAGGSIALAGDINHDGIDDLIVGAAGNDAGGSNAGAAYVVYGGANAALSGGILDLDLVAAGTGGFKIIGENSGDEAGHSVAAAGDINGDGIADLVVSAWHNAAGGTNAGAAYVIYGGANAALSNGVINLDTIATGVGGFKIVGENAGDAAGGSVTSVGDLNGDGIADLLIGAASAGAGAGSAYLVYGGANAALSNGILNLDNVAAGTGGFKIMGENAGDTAGLSVASAGDINGDGYGDLLIGAYNNDAGGSNAGAAYVVYGGLNPALSNGVIDLDTIAAGTGGFKIVGEAAGSYAGFNVAAAGDINGDGIGDLIVGAIHDNAGGSAAGAAYVVYGGANAALSNGILNLDTVAVGTGGFKIIGENAQDNAGYNVSSAGDVNGDGYADLMVGAFQNGAGGTNAGAAYLIYGGSNAALVGGILNLDLVAAGTGGFKITGENAGDHAGASVTTADLNHDGYSDLIVGADLNDGGGSDSGAAYVIYGGGKLGLILNGTSGSDTLTGKDGGDILTGGLGADILTGSLGADIFHYTATSQGGDTIKDFTKGEDLIGILNSIIGESSIGVLNFDGSAPGSGTIVFETVAGASTGAQHNSAKLIFDSSGHDLYYDGDGGASSSGRTLIAHFENAANLEANNITLMAG